MASLIYHSHSVAHSDAIGGDSFYENKEPLGEKAALYQKAFHKQVFSTSCQKQKTPASTSPDYDAAGVAPSLKDSVENVQQQFAAVCGSQRLASYSVSHLMKEESQKCSVLTASL